jgi:hypothetical protein
LCYNNEDFYHNENLAKALRNQRLFSFLKID